MSGSIQIAVLLLAAGLAEAQEGSRPTFLIASVKVNNSGSNSSSSNGSKGQLVATNLSLKRLVERAYGVKPFQVTGPDWMDAVRIDVTAKYPPDSKPEDRPLMLRALLEERFHLQVHKTQHETLGYILEVAKGGFKPKPAPGERDSDSSSNGNGHVRTLTVKSTSMAQLADTLSRNLGEIVVDRTEITGAYDFVLKWAEDDQKADEVDAPPTIFTALQETLGLRLKAGKVPVDVFVVDHIDRVPVEN